MAPLEQPEDDRTVLAIESLAGGVPAGMVTTGGTDQRAGRFMCGRDRHRAQWTRLRDHEFFARHPYPREI
ncbi:hypothetical protein SK571_33090 [Lentzea sp. BCCO 10_0798]|uniref:Uncharacterized protein n=1 Tax=Lentzea kristufekii TaxID=3095430 RepID=A0ABU4U0Y6_9PSEU|nr:hypothetical protein [Lentzea sp. BCCO 10_0798]MDX8054232.1 hypothetical protein [Lentzea sp. BCCO 10_0798]